MVVDVAVRAAIIDRQHVGLDEVEQRLAAVLVELDGFGDVLSKDRLEQRHDSVQDGRRVGDVVELQVHRCSFLEILGVGDQGFDVVRHIEELLECEAHDVEQEDLTLGEAVLTVVVGNVVGVEHHERSLNHINGAVHAGVAFVEANDCDFVLFLREFLQRTELTGSDSER